MVSLSNHKSLRGDAMSVVLYVGTDHGILTLRSDRGSSWEVEHESLKNWAVDDVALVPGEPGSVLAATRGDGVWLSRDFGASWTKPSYGRRGPGKVRSLAVTPAIQLGSMPGVSRSTCGSAMTSARDWDRFDSLWSLPSMSSITYPVPAVEPHVRDITLDPTDPNTIYAALQVGSMVRSRDRGNSWELLDREVDADIHTIVVDPADARNLFVATGGHDSRSGR